MTANSGTPSESRREAPSARFRLPGPLRCIPPGAGLREAIQILANHAVGKFRNPLLGNDHDVCRSGQKGPVKPEELPESSLEEISLDRLADLPTYRDPQAGPTLPIGPKEHEKKTGRKSPALSGDRQEVGAKQNPILLWKAEARTPGFVTTRMVSHP